VAALLALGGCGARPLGDPRPDGGVGGHRDAGEPNPPGPRTSRYIASNRNVDILFLIDDSGSMRLLQANLERNVHVLMDALETLPGGMPDVHIGVISPDMGAGDGSIAGCDATGGENGVLQSVARGVCTDTTLQPGATFISNVGGVKNYTGNLADVFTCIAALGEGGCGFERPFAALTRALGVDGRPAPAENQGFLREDAFLAIVMLANEDDCSAGPGVPLYDIVTNVDIASQLGPPLSFRCNEFGHLCPDGSGNLVRPNRHAPNNDVAAIVSYEGCRSNDTDGYLLGAADTANRIKALKADDGQVMLAAITGPPVPYQVTWKAPSTSDRSCGAAWCPWPTIAHSCNSADGSFGDPAVRIGGLVDAFGASGQMSSICASDYAPVLSSIARDVARYVTAPCIKGRIATLPGGRADCTVLDRATGEAVPACEDTGGRGVCWQLAAGGAGCGGLSVMVQGAPIADATVACTMCVPGRPDAARGCP
jgi:hypothetical protein